MRVQNRSIPVVCISIVAGAVALAFMTVDEIYVAAPGLACFVMVLWLWMILWDGAHKVPLFDVGMLCALTTLVYTVYPLLNFWMGGLEFGPLSDYRLQQYHITSAELGLFHLRHVLYLFSFVFFYSTFRGKGAIEAGNISSPSASTQQVIFVIFLILTGYFVVLRLLTGEFYSSSETYGERIATGLSVMLNMPLLLLQISNKLAGILIVFKLALLFIVVSRCRKQKWLIILFVWAAVEIFQTVYFKGPRSGLVLFLVATVLLYHRIIKPLSMKFLITSGISLFIFFNLLGVYRAYSDFASLQGTLSQSNASFFSRDNEFQIILGTAYDVLQRKMAGADFPWYLYINDFMTILPPQQLMPFEKITASEWYLREIGASGTGYGLMWGVIAQSIVGLDWIELAIRGSLLGFILARFHRWYLKHQTGFLASLLYLFSCLKVYFSFRDTTFSLLTNFVWEFIPFYILLCITVGILPRKMTGSIETELPVSPTI